MNNKNKVLVIKFGGTSVSSKEVVSTIISIVKRSLNKNPIVVVSAISGVTSALLALAQLPKNQLKKQIKSIRVIHQNLTNNLFADKKIRLAMMNYVDSQLKKVLKLAQRKNFTRQNLDELASYGEIISSHIIAAALQASGLNAEQVIATKLIVTDNNFTQAEFLPKETIKNSQTILKPLLKRKVIPIVTGFIAATKTGQITTLGRGGSDYSASIIGYCLKASEIQIWTDVNGIYTADPRVVPTARLIPKISYREASEMATFGAKVLHPRTIKPAIQKNIPVRILNTFNPQGRGTLITADLGPAGLKAVSLMKKTTLINLYSTNMLMARGFLVRIFEVFAKRNISIDLVSVSEVSVSVTLNNTDQLSKAIKDLATFCAVSVSSDFGIISLVGEKVAASKCLMRDVAELFCQNNITIRMISFGASDININLVIDTNRLEQAAQLIHNQILLKK